MRIFSCLFFIVYCSSSGFSQQPQYIWSRIINGSGNENTHLIHTDVQGNVYLAGESKGTVDLDPGPATLFASPTSTNEIQFIVKLNPLGQLVWAKWIDASDGDLSSICTDRNGNLYAAGRFTGQADFDPSAAVYTLSSTASYFSDFIWKLDSQGNFVFAGMLGGGTGGSMPLIKFDGLQNLYCSLLFAGACDLDPTTTISTYTAASVQGNPCLLKLDLNLNLVWAGVFIHSAYSTIYDFDFDSSKNVVFSLSITGNGTVDIDPGSSTQPYTVSGLGADQVVVKVGTGGNLLWHSELVPLVSGGKVLLNQVELDSGNDVFLTGIVGGTVDLVPGPATTTLSSGSINAQMVVVIRLNQSGSFANYDTLSVFPRAFEIDRDTLILGGTFSGTADLNPSTGINTGTSAGGVDVFLLSLTRDFGFVWAQTFGGPTLDNIDGICFSNIHEMYIAGYFDGSVDLDPGSLSSVFAAQAGIDGYISKFSPCGDMPLNLSSNNICAGESATLIASSPSAVTWFQNSTGGTAIGTGSVLITPTLSTGIQTIYASSESCSLMPRSVFITQVKASPTLTITGASQTICPGQKVTLAALGAHSYSWSGGPSSSIYTISPSETSIYTVTGTDNVSNCSSTITVTVKVGNCLSISENKINHFRVFPNPSNGAFTIFSENNTSAEITDLTGKRIRKVSLNIGANKIDLVGLNPGVYLLRGTEQLNSQPVLITVITGI